MNPTTIHDLGEQIKEGARLLILANEVNRSVEMIQNGERPYVSIDANGEKYTFYKESLTEPFLSQLAEVLETFGQEKINANVEKCDELISTPT